MIDSWLQILPTSPEEINPSSTRSHINGDDLVKFNPFISLVTPGLPDSFYAVLSIFNTFSLVSCNPIIHDEGMTCIDLDTTSGFIMATQGRYPDTLFYSLFRDNWDVASSGVNLLRVDHTSMSLEELVIQSTSDNPRGLDLCFCSKPNMNRIQTSCSITKNGGSLIVRVDNLVNDEWSRLILSFFSKVIAYKPATVSSVSSVIYLVCIGRGIQPVATLDERMIQLGSQLDTLERYRRSCLRQVLEKVDNTSLCDVHLAKMKYLGV